MRSKLDWLSFTLPVEVGEGVRSDEMPSIVRRAVDDTHGNLYKALGLETAAEPGKSRAPYALCWRFPDIGLAIYAHSRLNHALFELSGRGVDSLDAAGTLMPVLQTVLNRVTRLDVATDILTETRPRVFAEKRDVARFKSEGFITSPSGETYYVGSQSSDRYARVYRYNAPHERAALLRVETVVRAMNAKLTAQAVLEQGIEYVAAALGNVFGWQHEDWQPDYSDGARIKAHQPDRKRGKTEYWLSAQVAPAIRRLSSETGFDAHQWVNHVTGEKP